MCQGGMEQRVRVKHEVRGRKKQGGEGSENEEGEVER